MEIIFFLLIGMIAGWLAGRIYKGRSFGALGNIVVGVVGSMLGGFVFGLLGFSSSGLIGSLITATLGAILLLWIVKKLNL